MSRSCCSGPSRPTDVSEKGAPAVGTLLRRMALDRYWVALPEPIISGQFGSGQASSGQASSGAQCEVSAGEGHRVSPGSQYSLTIIWRRAPDYLAGLGAEQVPGRCRTDAVPWRA